MTSNNRAITIDENLSSLPANDITAKLTIQQTKTNFSLDSDNFLSRCETSVTATNNSPFQHYPHPSRSHFRTNTVKFRKYAPGFIFFKGLFRGAYIRRGLIIIAFRNRLGLQLEGNFCRQFFQCENDNIGALTRNWWQRNPSEHANFKQSSNKLYWKWNSSSKFIKI